jgi:hypothetical protein
MESILLLIYAKDCAFPVACPLEAKESTTAGEFTTWRV